MPSGSPLVAHFSSLNSRCDETEIVKKKKHEYHYAYFLLLGACIPILVMLTTRGPVLKNASADYSTVHHTPPFAKACMTHEHM